MARKPTDQLSPPYRRRIENAEKKGRTRQSARGHKPREHVARKKREIEENQISSQQERTIVGWYARTYNPAGYPGDARADLDNVLEFTRENGYERFVQWRKIWDAARRTYLRELEDGSYASRGEPYLIWLAGEADQSELSWLYYH